MIKLSVWTRSVAVCLAISQDTFVLPVPVSAFNPLTFTAPHILISKVAINRHVPSSVGPTFTLKFSQHPSIEEMSQSSILSERLFPLGTTPSSSENDALAAALSSYSQDKHRENVSSLVAFLTQYPQSAWQASLDVNLGIIYRRTGYYSLALDSWRQAWTDLKGNTDSQAQLLADRALGELSSLLSSLGRSEELQPLLKEVANRPLYGSSFEQVTNAREGLWLMKNMPGKSFKCGPYALGRILAFEHPTAPASQLVLDATSGPEGFSLSQVEDLSNKLGMGLQMAKRATGSAIITPSVINWKVGHYAAILRENKGYFLVQDPTFGNEVSIRAAAIDHEASGYFLVPQGKLPEGWQSVGEAEAQTVWGRGQVSNKQPDATTPGDPKCKPCPATAGMARYNVFAMLLSLNIQDTPVAYTPPYGPAVPFVVTFNQLEANQPSTFNYSNLGPLWIDNWMSYVVVPASAGQTAYINLRGGGRETYPSGNYLTTSSYPGYTAYYSADTKTEATLWITTSGNYERHLPDGSREVFSTANGSGLVFLNKVMDPAGNAISLTYDGSYRLTSLTDVLGQVTTLSYGFASDPLKITKVTDPFGRFATFSYSTAAPYQLVSITDEIGITSQFTYGSGSLMSALTTPYGQTFFNQTFAAANQAYRSVEVVDPLGGKEFFMSRLDGAGVSAIDPTIPSATNLSITNNFLNFRDTYYWDKKAVMDYGEEDYSKAVISHFLHTPDGTAEGPVLESVKNPLESRVWYNYPGQAQPYLQGTTSQPTISARLMSNGTTQVSYYQYNAIGNMTQSVDPLGRTLTYDYDLSNNIDLLDIRQTQGSNNDALLKMTYNGAHMPLTIVDASGQTEQLQYNSVNQLTQITDANGGFTAYSYTGGYLMKKTGPGPSLNSGDSTSFTYDSYGRVQTITDSQGYAVSYTYDNLDRPTSISYPDGSYEEFDYTYLDLSWHKDRLNRWTHNVYDANEQMSSSTDPLNRTTKYNWCKCGALLGLTDPNGNTTGWSRDAQSRITAKTYSDGTSYQYQYDPSTSRLASITDPKGQIQSYAYNQDDTVSAITYSGNSFSAHLGQASTPNVSFVYDPNYKRVTSMTDGTGITSYYYNPYSTWSASWPTAPGIGLGRISGESSPLLPGSQSSPGIAYSYNNLGFSTGRTIANSSNSVSVAYDTLERSSTVTNNLGAFTPTYVSTTNRVSAVSYPNGLTESLLYFPTSGNERLQEIKYVNSGSTIISKFDYTYNSVGDIITWQRQADAGTPTIYNLSYDSADQLTEALLTQSGATVHRHVEGYDLAGNRLSEQIDLGITSSSYNGLNQLTSQTGGGPLKFAGTLNQPSIVSLNGTPTGANPSTSFSGQVATTSGTNVVTVVSQNLAGLATTNKFQVVIPAPSAGNVRSYDADGNLTGDGTRTYEWDILNRLTAINNGSLRSEFTYDGKGRRVKIVEKSSGTITSTKQFVWVGNQLAEQRDATNAVTALFYDQGEIIGGTKYEYTRDHLGSIRELTTSAGTIQSRYDYDPYGRTTLVSGSNLSDFQYAGMYMHQPSGLNLTLFRAYDPNTARWLSRDPIEEDGGINLYGYVGNSPIDNIDPLGLTPITITVTLTNGTPTSSSGTINVTAPGQGNVNTGVLAPPTGNGGPGTAIPNGTYPARMNNNSGPGLDHHAVTIDQTPNGRTMIEIHPGNTPADTHGCFLPGTNDAPNHVANSRAATRAINNLINQTIAHDQATGQHTTITIVVQH